MFEERPSLYFRMSDAKGRAGGQMRWRCLSHFTTIPKDELILQTQLWIHLSFSRITKSNKKHSQVWSHNDPESTPYSPRRVRTGRNHNHLILIFIWCTYSGVNAYLQLISYYLHSLQLKFLTFSIKSAGPLQSEKRLIVGLVKNYQWVLHVFLWLQSQSSFSHWKNPLFRRGWTCETRTPLRPRTSRSSRTGTCSPAGRRSSCRRRLGLPCSRGDHS